MERVLGSKSILLSIPFYSPWLMGNHKGLPLRWSYTIIGRADPAPTLDVFLASPPWGD